MLGVVFVHGFNSSPGMWDAFSDLMADDEELAGAVTEAQPRFGYATALYRWRLTRAIPSLETVADSLKEYLRTEAAPSRFEYLVLVGHSMGGLVIQSYLARMLAEGRGRELARIKHVVLLATPNTGSLLLRDVRRVLLGANAQERQLRPLNAQVADTLRVVLRDVVNAPAEPAERTCGIGFSVYAGESDNVVPPGSAQAGFPEALALPGDHFTIARPASREHRSYSTLKRLLLAAADGDPPPESVTTLGPAALEVHDAAPAITSTGQGAGLTAYLPRPHDVELRDALAAVLAGGPSRLILLVGGSSTGKTRALYQALVELAPHAPLLHPVGKQALLELLKGGRLTPGCVLWLNESQRFLYGEDGEQAAGALRTVLESTTGIALLGTLWTEPFWSELTATGPGDPHAQARALLKHPVYTVRLNVPDHLDAQDLKAWRKLAENSGDTRLTKALSAGTTDGRVIQHLSGGPELLQAYLAGPGEHFTIREHALLTAALDARRLGHMTPLPAALLAAAADGDLPARHRSPDPHWARRDLDALATGRRADGTRTDIRDTLTALTALYPRGGAEPGYEPADYLDQHTRRLRTDQLGSTALWQALIEHTTDRDDQNRLADAAWNRGLRTTAVRLWHKAVTAGHPTTGLAYLGRALDPAYEAAAYSAIHADLTDPHAVSSLLHVLHRAGAEVAVTTLAMRAAEHVDLTDPYAVTDLLRELRRAGAESAVATLLDRDPATHADPTDPDAVARLLQVLREAGAETAAATLAMRAAEHIDPTDLRAVANLLRELRRAGAETAIATLAMRAAEHIDLTDPYAVTDLLRDLRGAGAESAVATLLDRDPATHADLTDPHAVADLLQVLREAGAEQAAATLLDRDPATHADPTDPDAVTTLLRVLREAGAEQAAATLAMRAAAHANLANPGAVTTLLQTLRQMRTGQSEAILASRSANAGQRCEHFAPYGREPDGQPSPPWTWHDLVQKHASPHVRT